MTPDSAINLCWNVVFAIAIVSALAIHRLSRRDRLDRETLERRDGEAKFWSAVERERRIDATMRRVPWFFA